MKFFDALKRLWPRRNSDLAKAQMMQPAPTSTELLTVVESPIHPQPALNAVEEQLSKATEEFRRTLDASTATAVENYKRLRNAAESQQDEHLRTSLMVYADNQLIQSIRWLLDSDDQFTTTTTTHEKY